MKGKYNILYVDDEEILLDVTKVYLEKSGCYSVDTARSAGEGLNKIARQNYDAIVSDYEMPEMNGIEFLTKIRSSGYDIPFIIFSGRGREDVALGAPNTRVDYYLQKGGQPKTMFAELGRNITQAISRKGAEIGLENKKSIKYSI